ncbi:hypothetical protein N431DRAFT_520728 [Stipitochalara longipes BDJ]|nr:hypothetical protein N431DRAFT_520728 [Stipitochalara longipes BDJ]
MKQVGDTIIYVSRYRLAGAESLTIFDLGASKNRQRVQWECHAGAVSSTRGYSQHEVGKCHGHLEYRAFSMEHPLFISHGSIL